MIINLTYRFHKPTSYRNLIVTCLPLRETYIGLGFVYVRHMSVRNGTFSKPYLLQPYVQKFQTFSEISVLTEALQQKTKFNFDQQFLSFDKKITFIICVLSMPFLSNYT